MDNIIYSNKGLEILHQFYRKKYVVWVEGDDDILFWTYVFDSNNFSNYHIKQAGGKSNLRTYINKVINENANILIACDKDYSEISCELMINDKIIYTYGYSIENTIYCPCSVTKNIEKYSKTRVDCLEEIEVWYTDFFNNLKELLIYDLANDKFKKSISVLGDSSKQYLENDSSPYLSPQKIKAKVKKIKDNFSIEEICACTELIDSYDKSPRYLIKGHFLTDAIRNLIKFKTCKGKKYSISNESLYNNTIDCCLHCGFKCDDKHYLKMQIDNALKAIGFVS